MAYIGHLDHIPACNASATSRTKPQTFARWGYYAILGAIALVPIVVPLIFKHLGL